MTEMANFQCIKCKKIEPIKEASNVIMLNGICYCSDCFNNMSLNEKRHALPGNKE